MPPEGHVQQFTIEFPRGCSPKELPVLWCMHATTTLGARYAQSCMHACQLTFGGHCKTLLRQSAHKCHYKIVDLPQPHLTPPWSHTKRMLPSRYTHTRAHTHTRTHTHTRVRLALSRSRSFTRLCKSRFSGIRTTSSITSDQINTVRPAFPDPTTTPETN